MLVCDQRGRVLAREDTCEYCGEHLGWILPGGEGLRRGFCGKKKCEKARKDRKLRLARKRKEGA